MLYHGDGNLDKNSGDGMWMGTGTTGKVGDGDKFLSPCSCHNTCIQEIEAPVDIDISIHGYQRKICG